MLGGEGGKDRCTAERSSPAAISKAALKLCRFMHSIAICVGARVMHRVRQTQDAGLPDSVQDQAREPTGELHRLWRGRRRKRQDLAWHTTRATEAELEHATAIAHNNPTRWPGRLGSSISPRSDVRKLSCDSRRSSQPAQPLQPIRRPAGHELCTVWLSTYCSETRTVDPPQRHMTDMSLFSHSTRSKRELASCRVQCWRAISLGY